jgi:myo-inositol-1(or 4)-monophosphatase
LLQANPEYADDLQLLFDHARMAGEIARTHFQKDIQKWDKGGGAGPVTEADIAIDRMLKAELTAARTDYGWLSEETEDDTARCACDTLFIVDPIDGTRAFMRGDADFCHALAVVRNGEVVASTAYFPIRDQMYWATKGGGAFRNGTRLSVRNRTNIEGAAALAGKLQMDPKNWPGGAPPVERVFKNSLVFRHCLIAEATFDIAFTLRDAWEWDVAAGELIAEEAGAAVSTSKGGRWRYNAEHPRMPGVVIGPPALHADVLARLQPR